MELFEYSLVLVRRNADARVQNGNFREAVAIRRLTRTLPPCGVNLMAFVRRLCRICFKRSRSAQTGVETEPPDSM